MGPSEVNPYAAPVGGNPSWRHGISCSRRTKMPSEQTLRCQTDLELLLGSFVKIITNNSLGRGIRHGFRYFNMKRHPQVCTYDINDSLPVFFVILRKPFKRIQTAKAYRCFIVPQLFYGLSVQISDTSFGGVMSVILSDLLGVELRTC